MWSILERIIHYFIYKALRLKLSEERYQSFVQFIKFGIVGLSNTFISYLIYLITLKVCEFVGVFMKHDYIVATFISFMLSVLWSFYWNKRFVFKFDGGIRLMLKALIKTYISYSFSGLFLSSILSIFWVETVGVSKLIAPILNLLISVPINFILNKFWAFKGEK